MVRLLLSSAGAIKLADFGLATAVLGGRVEAGRVGTPHYMAPELWMGGSASARSDLYGLAASLLFALTGKPPFPELDDIDALRAAHLGRPVDVPNTTPPQLREILLACLAKQASARPANARDVLRALIEMRGRRSTDMTDVSTQAPTKTPQRTPPRGDARETIPPDLRLDAMRNAALSTVMMLPRVDLFRAALLRDLMESRPLICVVGAADSTLASVVAHTASVAGNHIWWRSIVIGDDRRAVVQQVASLFGKRDVEKPEDVIDLAAAAAPSPARALAPEQIVAIHIQLRRHLAPGDVVDLRRMAGQAAQRRVVLLLESGARSLDSDLIQIADALATTARVLRLALRSTTERRGYANAIIAAAPQLGRWTDDAVTLAAFRAQQLGELEMLIANAAAVARLTGSKLVTTWCVEAALRHARWINTLDDLGPEWRSLPVTWPTQEIFALIKTLRRDLDGEDTDVDGAALR